MYLRTNEEAEAAEALHMASKLADELERNITSWRWVIVALHNAVQGFMVLSLRHGNGLMALSDESYKEWMEAYNNDELPPASEKLDSYPNLYKKVKSKEIGTIGGNKNFVPSGTQGKSIKKLNEFRNEFIHFTPKSWSLEVNGLPRICSDCVSFIEFLGWETENIFWHDLSSKEKSQLCCKKLSNQMEYLEGLYASISS